MKFHHLLHWFFLISPFTILVSCANMSQRNFTSQSHMVSDPDPLLSGFVDHMYFTREAKIEDITTKGKRKCRRNK